MKFALFPTIATLAFATARASAVELAAGHNHKHLRNRNHNRDLQEGIDMTLNKFVVNPDSQNNIFDASDVVNPEIVNGVEVSPPRKYGFFVSIGGCGASLVAPNVILSAAHCAGITGPATLGLHMNTVDGAEEFDNIEIIDFADSVIHPQYNSGSLDNDYWVIQLAHDSQLYQDQIVELDSPTDGFELGAGQDVTVIGMGTTSSGGVTPNVMQEVTVDYITNADCCTSYGYWCGEITNNMMCAARPGQDSCQGDSGGPIFDTTTQKQVGVVSWGYGCADSRYPGVYSRVSAQYDWIKAQIDNYSSGGTNPPAPKVPGQTYNSPEFWYDPRGPRYSCDSSYVSCSNSNANGGIAANDACSKCPGGGEVYNGPGSPTTTPTKSPIAAPCQGDTLKVEVDILTDDYPGETTWALINKCDGSTAASGGPYDTQEYLYSYSECLPPAEYEFEISDSWGDGICCGYGQGSYKVNYDGVDVVSNGGEFGTSEATTFGSCPSLAPVLAEFDSALGVLKCSDVGPSCTSGLLLDGKANNVEPNPPNTLDACTDGADGSYHADESIDAITVTAVGGGALQAGGLAEIEAKVWAWSDGAYDFADFYYTDSVNNAPVWTLINTVPANGGGLRSLKVEYKLPESSIQAVRVNFRFSGYQSSCTGGSWDDVDDLVFAVAPATEGITEVRAPKPVPALKPMQSSHCTVIGDRKRCIEASVCEWQNGKDKHCVAK